MKFYAIIRQLDRVDFFIEGLAPTEPTTIYPPMRPTEFVKQIDGWED